jgi:AAA family ATP:ADP antiporter
MSKAHPRLSPLERALRLFTDVRAGEGPTALLMFANVLLILFAYYLLKPLREGWLAISDVHGFSKLEIKAYTSFAQSLLLVFAATAYARRVGRWPRRVLITRTTVFCMSNIAVFWLLQPDFLIRNVSAVGIAFYLWVGMFGVFVVAQFWAFAADLYSQERGNRLLPMIAVGATSGAMLGSGLENQLVAHHWLEPRYLLLAALPPLALSVWLTRVVDRAEGGVGKAEQSGFESPVRDGRGALPLVFGNRFLLAIAGITLLFNWVKTNGDNQLFAAVQEALEHQVGLLGISGDPAVHAFVHDGTTAFFGNFFFWQNAAALLLQSLVASRLLKHGGFGAIFLLLPTIAMVSNAAMAFLPILWVIKSMKVAENATDYSINNTARHVLWLPMSEEVTFKAKPTIDSIFFRVGDGFAALTAMVGVQVLSWAVRSYFLMNVVLAAVWLAVGLWVVREHARLAGDDGAADPGPSVRARVAG